MPVIETHPSSEELAAFTLGTLGDETQASIESHVAACLSCQERAAGVPSDTLVELLRRAQARPTAPADTATEAPQAHTPAPWLREAVAVAPHPAALAGSGSANDPKAIPPELARHDRYRVVRLLGEGGMGSVYEAEQIVMQRRVALKVIRRADTTSPAVLERFRREVRAAARLSHPNIVTAYDAETAGELHFLVMEYVEGITLAWLVKERGPLPVEEACDYVRQAALGLQHAHERGLVHRDIKPDNLIRCSDGTVKVLDFGLAALKAESGGGMTEANVVMGTPEYMAPEQAEDSHSADIRADLYSLGCTLYFLLTGEPPYPAPTPLLKVLAHRNKRVPSLRRARPDVTPELAAVVERLLAKKPEDRNQTPHEVTAALQPFTRSAARPRRKRWPLLVAVMAALFAGIVLAGAVVYRIQTDKGELVITTDSDDVEVVVKQGGKVVRIIDTKTDKSITLDSGTYDLELKGAPAGLKLDIGKAILTRGETVLAKIERVAKPPGPPEEAVTVKPLHHIRWSDGKSFGVARVTQDGRYFLATRGGVDKVRIWETATGRLVREIDKAMLGLFTPDGKQVIVNYCDGRDHDECRVHDVETGKLIRRFGDGSTWGLWTAQSGTRLLRGVHYSRSQVWDWSTGNKLCDLEADYPGVWTHDMGHFIKQQGGKPPNLVFDMGTGKRSDAYAQFRDIPKLPGFSWDGKRYYLPNKDGSVCTFHDAATGKQIGSFDLKARGISGLGGILNGDQRLWVAAGKERDAWYVWDVESGRRLATLKFPAYVDPSACYLSYDGRTVLFAVEPDSLYLFRLPNPPPAKDKP